MILLQLSSAQGPEECCLAVKKALDRLIRSCPTRRRGNGVGNRNGPLL
ncbi:peptide chain release factor-like protein [Escherichia coli]|nr:peptide chain release factor-like protein [Escherichia coli]